MTKLATPQDVASYLGTTPDAIAQWRYRGTGPKFVKVGRSVRYRWEDVATWLDEQTRQGTADARALA